MKKIHSLVKASLASLITFGLVACNGTSGENGDDPFGDGATDSAPPVSLSVSTKTADCTTDNSSFTSGESVCVEATLRQNNQALSGEIVTFSSSLGELSTDSRLTNANGVAQIQVTSINGEVGAASIVATYEETNASSNYEFLASEDSVALQRPELSLSMQLNGAPTSRFTNGQRVTVLADLVDANGEPLENQIVNFSASLGQFAPDSALTNENGRAQVLFSANDGDLGADILIVQYQQEETLVTDTFNYQILTADEIAEQIVRFGSFDESGVFVENQLGVSEDLNNNGDVEISAGATLGVSVAVVDENDQRIAIPTPVTFTSNCVQNERATIDEQVNTINGEAFSTFEDLSCAGTSGNTDIIVATLVTNNETLTLTREIQLLAESIGSIEFVSAEPETITLSGTGGQGNTSVSTITFQVNGALGNPLTQQKVTFGLNTRTGGLSLSTDSVDENGEVY